MFMYVTMSCCCDKDVPSVDTKPQRGYIYLITGPMFARKTSTMLSEVERHLIAKRKCLIVKHKADIRYSSGDDVNIVTHGGKIFNDCPIVSSEVLKDVNTQHADMIEATHVIAISEGQFYEDLSETANLWANMGKIVIVEGLSGDYKQQAFKPIADLIGTVDRILHLKAVCMRCWVNDAPFTKRLDASNSKLVEIGGNDIYNAVCRNCL